jgi:hypothetical protein
MLRQFPEWKELLAKIEPEIAVNRLFTYDELDALAGMMVRRGRGYRQFTLMTRAALTEWNVAFECVRNIGYRIVTADEHNRLAVNQMRYSQRRLRKGLGLVAHVAAAELTAAAAAQNADLQCRIAKQIVDGKNNLRETGRIYEAARKELPRPAVS